MAETHHEKLLVGDVLIALTATKPDAVDDLQQMIDVVTKRLQAMKEADADRLDGSCQKYRERQRDTLQKWLLCLMDHLMIENTILNRYPTLKNKG